MKRLILMRHAKSDWSQPGQPEHDRPLNQRGRMAAPLMAAWLAEIGALPDAALISSAARCQETWARMGLATPAQTLPHLYHADADAMLEAARAAPEAAETVLLLAHMPHIKDTANLMLGGHVIGEFPTAKAAVIRFPDETWFEITFGEGELAAQAAPKDLV